MPKRRKNAGGRELRHLLGTLFLGGFTMLAPGLFQAEAAEPGSLRISGPVVRQKTNLVFVAQNPTPECVCNLQSATNLSSPIAWSNRMAGVPYQTNFAAVHTSTNPIFFRFRYKPYIQAPSILYAVNSTPLSITNIQVLPFEGATANLSMSVNFGPLSFGVTNGLTFTAGANGLPSFTVAGSYAALSAALPTLSYRGHGAVGVTDTLNIVLVNIGTNGTCSDSNSVRIPINNPPFAYPADFSGVGQLNVPAPGLLGCCAYDLEGDPMSVVPQTTGTAYGQLTLAQDGSVSYRPNIAPTTSIYEEFQYRIYDTFGSGMHSTSTPGRLTISIDPASAPIIRATQNR